MSSAPGNSAEQQLAAISQRIDKSAKVTAIVGIVLVAVIAVYFYIGIGQVKEFIEPELIVPYVGDQVGGMIPELANQATDTLIKEAPNWAEGLSDQAIDAAPKARGKLEEYIMDQSQVVIDQAVTIGDDEFRKLLRENRQTFEETLDALAEDEQYSDETVQVFLDAINNELGRDMQDQAEQVLGTLVALRERAEKLSAGKDLTEAERQIRFAAMIARRLQFQEQDPDKLVRERQAEEANSAKPPAGDDGDEKDGGESNDDDSGDADGDDSDKAGDDDAGN